MRKNKKCGKNKKGKLKVKINEKCGGNDVNHNLKNYGGIKKCVKN